MQRYLLLFLWTIVDCNRDCRIVLRHLEGSGEVEGIEAEFSRLLDAVVDLVNVVLEGEHLPTHDWCLRAKPFLCRYDLGGVVEDEIELSPPAVTFIDVLSDAIDGTHQLFQTGGDNRLSIELGVRQVRTDEGIDAELRRPSYIGRHLLVNEGFVVVVEVAMERAETNIIDERRENIVLHDDFRPGIEGLLGNFSIKAIHA